MGGGKRERKSRLDKGQGGAAEFTGFAAFATPPSTTTAAAAASASLVSTQNTVGKPKKESQQQQLRPSPLYIGSDSNVTLIFRKIGQKRDAITKTRALSELSTYAFPSSSEGTASLSRQEQIQAFLHLIFLYTTKLYYDNNPSVRAEVLNVLYAAKDHVPKAWKALLLPTSTASSSDICGMIWCATVDPMTDVRRCATRLMETILAETTTSGEEEKEKEKEKEKRLTLRKSVCDHFTTILGYGRATTLHDALFSAKRRGGIDGQSKKDKKSKQQSQAGDTMTSESEKEDMEERYERVVLCVLDGLTRLVNVYPEDDLKNYDLLSATTNENDKVEDDMDKKPTAKKDMTEFYYKDALDGNFVWKHLSTSRGSFRRATYRLVASLCRHGKSLIYSNMKKLSALVPSVLTSEKDPSNFPSLIEMVLLYIASFRYKQQTLNSLPPSNNNAAWDTTQCGIDANVFMKAMCKVLKRGCYGSSAVQWGPSMLPLVALLPQEDRKLHNQFLSGLWEGHKVTIGVADTSAIIAAVAECVSFLLLRRLSRPEEKSDRRNKDDEASTVEKTEKDDEGDTEKGIKETAQYFIDALSYYLVTPKLPKASSELPQCLARDLYKLDSASYERDDCAMADVKGWFWEEGIPSVMAIDNSNGEMLRRLGLLLQNVMEYAIQETSRKGYQPVATGARIMPSNKCTMNHLFPSCKNNFCQLLERSRSSERGIMQKNETELLLSIISYCGFEYLFANDQSHEEGTDISSIVENFCLNDLLRWIISRDSSPSHSNALKTDYKIFQYCLDALPTIIQKKVVWESILKEMIKAQCNLKNVALGLSILTSGMSENASDGFGGKIENIVQCQTLENLAVEVGNSAVEHFRYLSETHHGQLSDDSDVDEEQAACLLNESIFVETCLRFEQSGPMLISTEVVRKWIETTCKANQSDSVLLFDKLPDEDGSGTNALLKALLSYALSPSSALSIVEKVQLSLESWRQGGPIWNTKGAELASSPQIFDEFRLCSSSSLKKELISEQGKDDALIDLICHSWSERAWRLHQLCTTVNESFSQSTMALIGLDDVELWKSCAEEGNAKRAERFYLCLMHFLHNIEGTDIRRKIFWGQIEPEFPPTKLMVHVLVALIDTSKILLRSMERRVSRIRQFWELLGGKDGLSPEFIEACCREVVHHLSSIVQVIYDENKSEEHFSHLTRGISVLDFLAGILFGKFERTRHEVDSGEEKALADDVNASNIVEGDILWYVKDATSKDEKRMKVKVVKVHRDDFPNLYFTIREEGGAIAGDTASERQTVANRLKAQQFPVQNETKTAVRVKETDRKRQNFEELILKHLVKSRLAIPSLQGQPHSLSQIFADCINTAISRCGLTGKAGLGSVHYDVFHIITSLEKFVCDSIARGDISDGTTVALSCLASAMGYGFFTESSTMNFDILRFKPDSSISMILSLYEDVKWLHENSSGKKELSFHRTVLIWISVAVTTIQEGDIFRKLMNVLNSIGSCLLNVSCGKSEQSLQDTLIFMETVGATQRVAHQCIDYTSDNGAEKDIMSTLTMCFTSIWQNNEDTGVFIGNTDAAIAKPVWLHPFVSILKHNLQENEENILFGSKFFSEDLVALLFTKNKRWCAFQILSVISRGKGRLYSGDTIVLPKETILRLESWKEYLEEEEAEELCEDVQVAASWLPHHLMAEIESWEEDMELHEDALESTVIGRLLLWIACLDFLDSAAVSDMRNRGSISSYIERTGALQKILSLALRYAVINNHKDENWKSCTSMCNDDNDGYDFKVPKIATLVVFRTVEVLPTLVKKWWSDDCPRSLQSQVSEFVQYRVAPDTLKRELARINSASGIGDMEVSGSCVSREVTATYVQDECKLSVMIKIPPSFPLRNVEVDCQKTLGIAEKRWRHWALQIMRMLNSQDGSVLDALLLWKQNVDKEFEGVEPCPVCYSVLCVKTHAMPNLECKTCHNRFHTSCLYKWFQSSGKSQCVLCQQPWSGAKI